MINEGESGAFVEGWVELANGCVCCTVKHSLVQALEQLVQMKKLDHILLETTGLVNLTPMASVLWLNDQLESSVRLDSLVTIVDARNLHFQLNRDRDSSSVSKIFLQIAFIVVTFQRDLKAYDTTHATLLEELLEESKSISSS
ncbi:hypothetical protein REPUB_Repub01dG0145300 [Reevesia pubescens]